MQQGPFIAEDEFLIRELCGPSVRRLMEGFLCCSQTENSLGVCCQSKINEEASKNAPVSLVWFAVDAEVV